MYYNGTERAIYSKSQFVTHCYNAIYSIICILIFIYIYIQYTGIHILYIQVYSANTDV